LATARGPLSAGAQVRLAIAARLSGQAGVGVTSGVIATGVEETLEVAPIPTPLEHLYRVHCPLHDVGGGSSGAPAVDEQFRVVGYVVAGNSEQTEAYIVSAGYWAPRVHA
jgi:hypothetical protein